MLLLCILAFVLLFVLVILCAPSIENTLLFHGAPITNPDELQSFDTYRSLPCGARLYVLNYTGSELTPPKVLFLHGNAGNAQLLIPVIQPFTKLFEVYVLE